MKRRKFSLSAASAVVASSLPLVLANSVQAQPKPFQASKDYIELKKPAPVDTPVGKVEVIEFFWYGCGHCNSFEPIFSEWAKRQPDYLAIKRIPVAFQSSFIPQQKLYFALEALGLVESIHAKVFQAVHIQRLNLSTDEKILDWVVKQGVDKTKFSDAYASFSVQTKVRRATEIQNAYQLEGVPSMGVAGRYYIDGGIAGSMNRVLDVVEYLAKQSQAKS